MGDIELRSSTPGGKTRFSASAISLLGHALNDIEELQQICKQGVSNANEDGKLPQEVTEEVAESDVLCHRETHQLKIPERTSSRRFNYVEANARIKYGRSRIQQRLTRIDEDMVEEDAQTGHHSRRGLKQKSTRDNRLVKQDAIAEQPLLRVPKQRIGALQSATKSDTLAGHGSMRFSSPSPNKPDNSVRANNLSTTAKSRVHFDDEKILNSSSAQSSTSISNTMRSIALPRRASSPLSTISEADSFVVPLASFRPQDETRDTSSEQFLMSGALPVVTSESLPETIEPEIEPDAETISQSISLLEKLERFHARNLELKAKISSLKSKHEAAVTKSAKRRLGLRDPWC